MKLKAKHFGRFETEKVSKDRNLREPCAEQTIQKERKVWQNKLSFIISVVNYKKTVVYR